MKTIRYDGPRPSILVLAEGALYRLRRGEPGEVPEEAAARLCEREHFTEADPVPDTVANPFCWQDAPLEGDPGETL